MALVSDGTTKCYSIASQRRAGRTCGTQLEGGRIITSYHLGGFWLPIKVRWVDN